MTEKYITSKLKKIYASTIWTDGKDGFCWKI